MKSLLKRTLRSCLQLVNYHHGIAQNVRQRTWLRVEQLEDRTLPSAGPLIFGDDFNLAAGSQPSTATWTAFNATDPNNANVVYTNSTTTLHVVDDAGALDGKALAMTLLPDAAVLGRYNSSEIRTSVDPIAGNILYGHIEARIKLPGGPNGQGDGIWPAFWMLGSNFPIVGWPTCGEIDIMENKGSTPGQNQGTIHGPGYRDAGVTSFYNLPSGQNFYSGYHVFAIDWSPNSVQFSVDGNTYSTMTPASLPGGGVWEFNHPFFLILDVAEGGPFAGPATANSTYPQTMYVDYVRVNALPPSLSLSTVSLSSSTISPGGSTTVTLTVRDANGNVQSPGGQSVAFSLVDGIGGQGTFDSVIDQHDGTYTAAFTGTVSGNNSITATLNGQALTSTPASITIDTAITVFTQPISQSVNVGGTATFTANANGSPTPTIQWQVSTNGGSSWSDIAGATSNIYKFTPSLSQTGSQYRAVFTNAAKTVNSNAATLTVNSAYSYDAVINAYYSYSGAYNAYIAQPTAYAYQAYMNSLWGWTYAKFAFDYGKQGNVATSEAYAAAAANSLNLAQLYSIADYRATLNLNSYWAYVYAYRGYIYSWYTSQGR